MQPITTRYKGYCFRSRLEARWAVYFEAIGLEWNHEKEGFIFDNGVCYLPDFWLPQVKMWAEVEPGDFDKEELGKVYSLVQESRFSCILLDGLPKTMKIYDVI